MTTDAEINILTEQVMEPKHYGLFPDTEVIDIIRRILTPQEFMGYCKGNIMKYKLRAGLKGSADVDIAKANVYSDWLDEKYMETR